MLALVLSSLLCLPARAEVPEEASRQAVALVEERYLYPAEVDAAEMLYAAARELADEVEWLLVRREGKTLIFSHGRGEDLGEVRVESLAGLPEGIEAMRAVVLGAGENVGEVDLRLTAMQGMMTALDPYSRVLAGEGLKQFDVRMTGRMDGIGATISAREGRLWVKALNPGGPALKSGMQQGDWLLRVDGVSTVGMTVADAVSRLRGDRGTSVEVEVEREGEVRTLRIERAEIVVPNVDWDVLPGPVAYVQIDHFSQVTLDNLQGALRELRERGALEKGMILDLRGNSGGSMKQAAGVADLFVDHGTLLRTAGADGGEVPQLQARMEAKAGDRLDIPLFLLVDEDSASASEILAGTLLELDRVALVGRRTFGKGVVQKVYPLNEEVRLKLTVARYLVANDRPIDAGIVPDLTVADVYFDDRGPHFYGWSEADTGVRFEANLPRVEVGPGWGDYVHDPGDWTRELARRAVLRAQGPGRAAALTALASVEKEARETAQLALAGALSEGNIDWTPANKKGPMPNVDVSLRAVPLGEDRYVVEATVRSADAAPLAQVVVELRCESFGPWDGLIVPIGWVGPGELGQGRVEVSIKPAIHPRHDPVTAVLRADQRPEAAVKPLVLAAESSNKPTLFAEAALVGEGTDRQVQVVFHNTGEVAVEELSVSFAHPGDLPMEWRSARAQPLHLEPHGQAELRLDLALGEGAPAVLPLQLQASAEGFRSLLSWPLPLPTTGQKITVIPPVIEPILLPVEVETGAVPLQFGVRDDGIIDHALLYVDGEKVAWAGEGHEIIRFEANLSPGVHRLTVIAEDSGGARSTEHYRVLALDGGVVSTEVHDKNQE